MSHEPRLFVAVPLDDGARAAVEAVVATVRESARDDRRIRWVRLDGLHLTLRFLGPTPESRLADLADATGEAARTGRRHRLVLDHAGGFPSGHRPRTIWLGAADGADQLADLAAELNRALVGHGWPAEERPFRAHLTLARADGARTGPAVVEALVAAMDGRPITSAIDRVSIYESVTGGGPARYLERVTLPLD